MIRLRFKIFLGSGFRDLSLSLSLLFLCVCGGGGGVFACVLAFVGVWGGRMGVRARTFVCVRKMR